MRIEVKIEEVKILINEDKTNSLRKLAAETHYKKNLLFITFSMK